MGKERTYACEFEDFSGKVFEDGGYVDCSCAGISLVCIYNDDAVAMTVRGTNLWHRLSSYSGCCS